MNSIWISLQFVTVFHAGLEAAPQGFGLPWFHPPPWPLHAVEQAPFPPAIYDPAPGHVQYLYHPEPNELDFQQTLRLPALDDAPFDELSGDYFDEDGLRQNPTSDDNCSRRRWRKTVCFNSTTVQKCRANGSSISRQCPNGWTCTAGTCRRPRRFLRPFACPAAGFFPDPHTCRVFHVCTSANNNGAVTYTATNETCYWPQVYDPRSQACQREGRETPCYRFKCAGRAAVAYPGDANIYAACSSNGQISGLMRCQPQYGWDDVQQQCVTPYCTEEGNIADPSSTTSYYTCSRVFKRLVRSGPKECPNGITFNQNLGICSGSNPQRAISTAAEDSAERNGTSAEDSSNYE